MKKQFSPKPQSFDRTLPCKGRSFWWLFAFAIFAIGWIVLVIFREKSRHLSAPFAQLEQPTTEESVFAPWTDALQLPSANLEHVDIAVLNLLCAQNLSNAGEINIPAQLATLDRWAKRVKAETERHLYRFRTNPQEFYSSEGYFRMLMMAVVFYEDFNVRYNPERMSNPSEISAEDRFFADSRDIFLHGLLEDRHMGTCSSMPVLYAAVGRRLGYPLKLVTTKAHLFLRWEDEKERFNLEATGRGMNRYNDEHFKNWPFPVSEDEIRTEGYLKSLTAVEELAVFLSLRGNCLKEAGQIREAARCYGRAAQLAPTVRSYGLLLADLQQPPLR